MRKLAACLVIFAWPAVAEDAPKSQAGTQFMDRCLTDVTANRIATLKRQAPDYAATLDEEALQAGGMSSAKKACPCFLHVIAVASDTAGKTPEEKVSAFLAYLDALETERSAPMHPMVPRLTRLCGLRSTVLPQNWVQK